METLKINRKDKVKTYQKHETKKRKKRKLEKDKNKKQENLRKQKLKFQTHRHRRRKSVKRKEESGKEPPSVPNKVAFQIKWRRLSGYSFLYFLYISIRKYAN
jgi:hypothetical protein